MSRAPRLAKACGFCARDFRLGDQVERKGGMVVHLRCPKTSEEASAPVVVPAQEGTKVRGRARDVAPPEFKSKLEARYYEHLKGRMLRGEIASFAYEAEKLRLADGAYYTPDFRVVTAERDVQFHETKGFMREAARVRLRVAAELHPYAFFLVFDKGGGEFLVQPHDAAAPQKSPKKRA